MGRKLLKAALIALPAAAILFCLWYTRPQGWESAAGFPEPSRVVCYYYTPAYEYGEDGTLYSYTDGWQIDGQNGDDPAIGALMEALRGVRYRASLMNLSNLWNPRSGYGISNSEIPILFSFEDEEKGLASLDIFGETVFIRVLANDCVYEFKTDPALYQRLLDVLKTHGDYRRK